MGNKSKSAANRAHQRQHRRDEHKDESRISKQDDEKSAAGLTHGFWLQQHSWLHTVDQQQRKKDSQPERPETNKQRGRKSDQQQADGVPVSGADRRPQKLVARLTSGLMRTLTSLSSSHESVNVRPESRQSEQLQPTSKRRLRFTANTSSNSGKTACYSTLNLPAASSGSSQSPLLMATNQEETLKAGGGGGSTSSTSLSLSPYRRLARALKSPNKRRQQLQQTDSVAAACQKRSRLMRLAHSCSSSATSAHLAVQKETRTYQSSGGLLSSILISPLFRSKVRHQSKDDDQSGGAHSDKRQKSGNERLDKRSGKKWSEIRGARGTGKSWSGSDGSIGPTEASECCRLGIEGRQDEKFDRSRTIATDAGASSDCRQQQQQRKLDKAASGYLANANELPADEHQPSRANSMTHNSSSNNNSSSSNNNNNRQLAGESDRTRLTAAESSLLPLIQATTTGGSSSSLASSSMICFDSGQSNAESATRRKTTFAGNQELDLEHDDDDDAGAAAAGCEEQEGEADSEQPIQVVQIGGQAMSSRDPGQPRAVSQPVGSGGRNLSNGAPDPDSSAAKNETPPPSGGMGGSLKNNFKKLIKRQQSVDSYRMARDLKNKLRRQNEARNKHRGNEATKTKSVGDVEQQQPSATDSHQTNGANGQRKSSASIVPRNRKFSMLTDFRSVFNAPNDDQMSHSTRQQHHNSNQIELRQAAAALRISIDPYAKAGTFELPAFRAVISSNQRPEVALEEAVDTPSLRQPDSKPTPPNTLSLMPSGGQVSFSGCITPTYPTHHLPSPKYVSPSAKKYSNASTISSSLGGESLLLGAGPNCHPSASSFQGRGTSICLANQTGQINNNQMNNALMMASTTTTTLSTNNDLAGSHERQQQQSDTENTSGSGSPMRLAHQQQQQRQATARFVGIQLKSFASNEQLAAIAAARRADLAEHSYDNKCGLGEDMKFLASLPELCDITFLVGETREPVCAVKSVLAARSRVFSKILFGNRMRAFNRQQQVQLSNQRTSDATDLMPASQDTNNGNLDRRSSSPKPPARNALTNNRSSSPVASARSVSPNQTQVSSGLQHWSVTSDASGYAQAAALDLNHHRQQQSRRESLERSAGRSSVVSTGTSQMGRESAISQLSQTSQTSLGSQQPLIIGPGQTAALAPMPSGPKRNKRATLARDVVVSGAGPVTGNGSGLGNSASAGVVQQSPTKQLDRQHSREAASSRLSRMFMKRASDPSIKQQQQQTSGPNQNYLDKMSSSQMSTTMIIEEFEPDVFRQLIEYIHTGCVLLQARTLLGLLNAADYYGLEQLRKACLRFVSCCITVDTVCSLLSTAERYIQYKCTKSIVQKVLEFVDTHADEIFKLNAFGLLPEHVVRLILARDGLQADEQAKYNGVYTWCEHYCRSYELTNMADVMRNFLDFIQFHKIPTNILLSEIYPTHTVPDTIFLGALAYQADPKNMEPQPLKARRMTLPNPTFPKDQSSDELNDNDDRSATATAQQQQQQQPQQQQQQQEITGSRAGHPVAGPSFSSSWSRESESRRESNQQEQRTRQASRDSTSSSGQRVQQAAATRTSSVGRKSLGCGQQQQSGSNRATSAAATQRARKGSFAQVSISGVMRLSHKLSIKRRAGRGDSLAIDGGNSRRVSTLSKQQSLLSSTGTRSSSAANDNLSAADPLRLGQQILDAYLEQQRQRELEEAEEKRRQAEQRAADQAALGGSSTQLAEQAQQTKQPIVKVSLSSTRKSFKDFKHISRRIFMRHSSSNKMVQQQQQQQRQQSPIAAGLSAGSSCSSTSLNLGSGGSPGAGQQQQQQQTTTKENQPSSAIKRRNVLKIKRSETVFETSGSGPSPSSRLSHQLSANLLAK